MNSCWTYRIRFILLVLGMVLLSGCVEKSENVVVTTTTTTTAPSTTVITGITTSTSTTTSTTTTLTTTSTTIASSFLDDSEGYGTVEGVVIYNNTPQRLVHVMAIYNNSMIEDTYTDKFAKYELKIPAGYEYDITIDFRNKTFSQKVFVAAGYRHSASFVIKE